MNIPNLDSIAAAAWKRYHTRYNTQKEGRTAAIAANRAYDNYLKQELQHLFERLSRGGKNMYYRLTGTDYVFVIRRNRGRKDTREGWVTTTKHVDTHWMQWDYLGDMSGIGGLFHSGLAKIKETTR